MHICKKFNYVFFLSNVDYYRKMHADLHYLTNVRIMHIIPQQTNEGLLFNVVPVQSSANPYAYKNISGYVGLDKFFDQEFHEKNPIIFLFEAGYYVWFKLEKFAFLQMLRKNYSDCKLVCQFCNPIHYYQRTYQFFCDDFSLKELHGIFDLVTTYNQLDSINYELTHYEGIYSIIPPPPLFLAWIKIKRTLIYFSLAKQKTD